jgi:hypothetical protein
MPTEITEPTLVPVSGTVEVSWTMVSGKPASFPAAAHSHAISSVTGLADALAGLTQAIEEVEAGGPSDLTYTGPSPANVTLGGIPAGTALTGKTTSEILAALLVAYQAPAFSSFVITGFTSGQVLEVGTTFAAPKTFTWGVSNAANLTANTIILRDVSNSVNIATGLANDGTETIAATGAWNAALTTAGKQFRILGTNSQGASFQRDFSLVGVHPWFWGKVTTATRPTANQALINSGTKVVAASDGTISVPFASGDGDFIWFAIPATSTAKTAWWQSALNAGAIGGAVSPGGNLFPAATTVAITTGLWSGVNYLIFVANYRTAAAALEFRNS